MRRQIMDELTTPFHGNGQPDFLSLINAEENMLESAKKISSARPDEQQCSHPLPQLLPPSSDTPKEVQHLKPETFSEPTLPIDGLSASVQDYIRAVSESYGCPQDFVVAICFITAGVAAGKKVLLVTNPYTNYPCDFISMVGKPSRNKTGPLKEVTRPLREQDKANFAKFAEEKAAYDQSKREDRSYSGEQPVFHQRVVGDSSPESRNALLAQGDMMIVVADELKAFIDSFGRYTKGGNGAGSEVSQLLSTWSNVSFTINRKSEETKLVDDPAMSIIGGIQPALLGKTFGTDILMDSGFTQRFLFVFPDKVKFVKRRDRKSMTQEIRDSWSDIIGRLFNMESLALRLSHEAERLYADYADANDMKADAEEDSYIGGVIQKMNIHVLRLAIMAHLLSNHWSEPVITGEAMSYAIRIAEYFTRVHVERIYPLLKDSAGVQRMMTNGDLLRAINRQFKIKSQNSLAEVLGVSQQYINKTLKEQ